MAELSIAGNTILSIRIKKTALNPDGTLGEVTLEKDGQTIYLTALAARSMAEHILDKVPSPEAN